MSNFRILYYDNDRSYGTTSSGITLKKLCQQLWEYRAAIGVVAYQADEENSEDSVRWELNGTWYTTAEIERIKKMPAFL